MVRILASSGSKRSTALPDVPTFEELGVKNVEAIGWFGCFAPARTPKAIVFTQNRAINTAPTSPDVVAKIVASDYAKWGPIVTASGFRPE